MFYLVLVYEIPDWKICFIITDHDSNMLRIVQNLSIPHVDCFDHALNIAVALIFSLNGVKDVVHKVKLVYNIFLHSLKAVRKIENIQERFRLPKKMFYSIL